jgi:hypothetical protein
MNRCNVGWKARYIRRQGTLCAGAMATQRLSCSDEQRIVGQSSFETDSIGSSPPRRSDRKEEASTRIRSGLEHVSRGAKPARWMPNLICKAQR